MRCRITFTASLVSVLCAAMTAHAQTRALDAFVGISTSRGGSRNYDDELGKSGELTLAFRRTSRSGRVVAITAGSRNRLANGDPCTVDPQLAGCRPETPLVAHVGALAGLEKTKGGCTLRLLAGPAVYVGDIRTNLGGQLQIDAAIGPGHVAFLVAARGNVVAPFADRPLRLGSLGLGLRIQ